MAIGLLHTGARSQEGTNRVEFLPDTKVFPLFAADALTHGISLSRVTGNRDWIGTIGGYVPILGSTFEKVEVQIGVAVTAFNRLIKPPGLTVYTVDYRVDFPLDVRLSLVAVRIALGHYSCHFADDGIELLGKRSIQSVKDYVSVAGVHDVTAIGGHVYTAAQFNYNNVPVRNRKWQVQFGAEGGNFPLGQFVRLYAAVDTKVKQEVAWGSTQSYQIGARLFQKGSRAIRLAYTLRRGFDERGQFFDRHETASLLSLFVDI
jgi:hypothetical protein